jgi:hypothetical protein
MARRSPPVPLAEGELEDLLHRLAPRIAALFRDHGASEDEASRLLADSLAAISGRWARLVNRERWLLRKLEKSLRASGGPAG